MLICLQAGFMKFRFGRLLIALIFCYQPAMADGIYRWVDEQGRVHFSDQPQSKAQAEHIEIEGPVRQSDSELDQQRLDANRQWFEAQQKRREADAAKKRKAEKKAEKKAKASKVKAQTSCSHQKKKLADKQAELSAKKRAGIKVSEESRLKMQIQLLEDKISRECG